VGFEGGYGGLMSRAEGSLAFSQGEKKVADFWPVRKCDNSALLSMNN
jgi:hypothetical protein